MKKHKSKVERPRTLKRKLMSALCMLLISSILMTATTYAWLVLSTAPEVSGITTNIGANGALEIALLTGETRQDLSKIRTSIGGSIANERVGTANTTWGNLIDLTVADYGLNELVLLPARLQYSRQSDGTYKVNSGLLSVPIYGFDGRIVELTDNTVSAIYANKEFAYTVGVQDYGVRAIGTSDTLSAQASALAMAKGNIATYTKNANSTAASTLNKNGPDLFGMILAYSANRDAAFDNADVAVIKAMVTDLESAVNYIDLALRQGLVAVAASAIEDKTLFGTVQDQITDTTKNLTEVIVELSAYEGVTVPEGYTTWVSKAEASKNNLDAASIACDELTGGSYTWDQLQNPLSYIMNMDQVYINDTPFDEFDSSMTGELMTTGAVLTLPTGSGVFADVADFAGDYTAAFTSGVAVEIETLSTVQDGPYLTALSNKVKDLQAADGSGSGVQSVELSATYGYALDMAFRCNAAGTSNLLLQTAGVQRVYGDSTSSSTMGGGSYMEFSTKDATFTLDQMLRLMDAVRVAFIDDQGNLLKVAKLNTSNRTVTNGVVKAPLYLYEYSFSEEDGAMIMGERQKTENAITSLEQNVAKAVSAVVWLDGDIVDNTMVSATESASLNGVLNLQFATDANLVPAGNTALKNATTDKTELKAAVEEAKATYEAGQGTYTTVSWNTFVDAYTYASAVSESADATEAQVRIASGNLAQASDNLQPVSHDALTQKVNEVRDMMGMTTDVVGYVLYDETNKTYVTVDTYTEEQKDNALGVVYRVDYEKNLHDEGNGVETPVYTDASWSALAAALYDAEAANMCDKTTDAQLDAAITALETAKKNLQHRVFYIPYEFEEVVYYYAIPRSGEAEEAVGDTYGRWYDAEFKRVTSDLTILNLDARAQLAEVAAIEQSKHVTSMSITVPTVEIYSDVYPALRDEEILALQWDIPEHLFVDAPMIISITSEQIAALTDLRAEAEALNRDEYAELQVSESLIAEVTRVITGVYVPSETEAAGLISRLQTAVEAATPITSGQIAELISLKAQAEALNQDEYAELQVSESLIAEATGAIAGTNELSEAEADDLISRLQTAVYAETPITSGQIAELTSLKAEAETLNQDEYAELQVSEDLITEADGAIAGTNELTEAEAADLIDRLQAAVYAAAPVPATSEQIAQLTSLKAQAEALNQDGFTDLQVSEDLITEATDAINSTNVIYRGEAASLIDRLQTAVYAATPDAITSEQIAELTGLKAEAEALNQDGFTDLQVPEDLITEADGAITGTNALLAAEAADLIDRLQTAVDAATPDPATSVQIAQLTSLKAEAEALNQDGYTNLQVSVDLITEADGAIASANALSAAEAASLIYSLRAAVYAATPITSVQIAQLTSLKAEAETLNKDGHTDLQVSEDLITEADGAIAGTNVLSVAEAADLIDRLQAAIEAATPQPMTADQRIVLTAAINAAKAVEGYDNSSEPALVDDEETGADPLASLRAAVAEVEDLLALETGAAAADADAKLAALNAALTALGEKEVTAYNTLQYTVPVSSDLKGVAHAVEIPHKTLRSTGELGTGTISVVVLTKSGIVFTASVDVEVYIPAEDVDILAAEAAWDNTIQAGETTTLSAELVSIDDPTTETIKKYTWASSNTEVLTVSKEETAACTVNAVAAGTARVTLSVTTVQGNVYTDEILITVTAVPEPEEEEPAEPGAGGGTEENGQTGETGGTT